MSERMTMHVFPRHLNRFIRQKVYRLIFLTVTGWALVANSQAEVLTANYSWLGALPGYQVQSGDMAQGTFHLALGPSTALSVWRTANPGAQNKEVSRFNRLRDPFLAPFKNPTPAPKAPTLPRDPKPSPALVPLPGKLLSVVHGPWGFQAVILLASHEHLVVQLGEPVAHTGWHVTDIQEDHVRLEYVRTPSSPGGSDQSRSAMLFFERQPGS